MSLTQYEWIQLFGILIIFNTGFTTPYLLCPRLTSQYVWTQSWTHDIISFHSIISQLDYETKILHNNIFGVFKICDWFKIILRSTPKMDNWNEIRSITAMLGEIWTKLSNQRIILAYCIIIHIIKHGWNELNMLNMLSIVIKIH